VLFKGNRSRTDKDAARLGITIMASCQNICMRTALETPLCAPSTSQSSQTSLRPGKHAVSAPFFGRGCEVLKQGYAEGSRKVSRSYVAQTARSCMATAQRPAQTSQSSKVAEYNESMKRAMANPYEYHHDLGIYYTRITDNLIVGSQPQTPEDVERLFHQEGITAIVNLQQDHDIAYWQVDLSPIRKRCEELGVVHIRRPARDFDPHSLRQELPRMVAAIDKLTCEGRNVYVHCTAGLGRAPGCAIAYLFWFQHMTMDQAYELLTSKRPCGPKKDAIRAATFDLVKGAFSWESFEQLPDHAFNNVAPWERDLIQDKVRNLYQ